MNETLKIVFGLLGGLALFLFGMNSMSDALQKSAGDRMKKILGFLTQNAGMGALAGALVTAILQSSSATTVMVIGFVSAGLMTLPQAISVIFGANIGTTMTAQLIAFKISDYIFPIIFIGFLINFLSKKEKSKNIGMVILSFGILFEGIEIMSSVMKPLANSPFFTDLMSRVKEYPPLGILLGLCMTLVVQSSSATIAVLQSFASQAGPDGVSSVIGLTGAIPILLGDNIGTTITALLASIGQSKNAKRAAVAHSFFNISGTLVFVWIIPYFAKFVAWISPKGNEVDIISRQIANAHTTFNVVCTLVWLPLLPVMVRLVRFVIRGTDRNEKEAFQPQFLDDSMLNQPVPALYLISREIDRTAALTSDLLRAAQKEVSGSVKNEPAEDFDTILSRVRQLQNAVSDYITRLFASGTLTEEQAEQAAGLLTVTNNLDRIADRGDEITCTFRQLRHDGHKLSDGAKEDLKSCFQISRKLLERAMESLKSGDTAIAEKIEKDKNKMRKAQKQFNKAHLERVKDQKCDPSLTPIYGQILYSFDRMVDNCAGIAEETMDHTSFVTIENALPENTQATD